MRTEAGVSQGPNGVVATAEMEGAVATMGGGVFFANRIDDAFAVVETGVPEPRLLRLRLPPRQAPAPFRSNPCSLISPPRARQRL
jgi:hypothetical protein